MAQTINRVACSPDQIKKICLEVMPMGIPVGVEGRPGTAKSATGKALAAEFSKKFGEDFKTIMFNCAYHEPTDVVGLPFVKDGRAHMAVTDLWPTTPNNVIVVEELTKGPKLIQNALGELMLEGSLRGYKLPANTFFFVSWNSRTDGAGDTGILSHVANRMMVLSMRVDPDGTLDYGIANNWDPLVLGFLNQNKHMVFHEETFSQNGGKFNPDRPSFPSPRSWDKVQRVVSTGLPDELEIAAVSGLVGDGACREFVAYKQLAKEIPDINLCIKSPKTAPIPKENSIMYALVLSLTYATNAKNASSICEYISRLRPEYLVLYAKSVAKARPEFFSAIDSKYILKVGTAIDE